MQWQAKGKLLVVALLVVVVVDTLRIELEEIHEMQCILLLLSLPLHQEPLQVPLSFLVPMLSLMQSSLLLTPLAKVSSFWSGGGKKRIN